MDYLGNQLDLSYDASSFTIVLVEGNGFPLSTGVVSGMKSQYLRTSFDQLASKIINYQPLTLGNPIVFALPSSPIVIF